MEIEKNDYIFGVHSVLEALQAGKQIDKVFIKKGIENDAVKALTRELRTHNIPIQLVPIEKLNRITRKNHQGVIAWISPVIYQNLEEIITSAFEKGRTPSVIILDGITDTRNFGAIARTAACADFDAIIVPTKGAALITPDAMKTSAGALHSLPICRVLSLPKTVRFLKDSGLQVVAASEKSEKTYFSAELSGPIAIVMGAEDTGVSNEIIRFCDEILMIPMLGKISSLNVSVATGIMTYEVIRQRN